MTRIRVLLLAALVSVAPLTDAVAQDRGARSERRDRPPAEAREAPRIEVRDAVRRVSAGREGRFLGASERRGDIVVRWEYPGGRVADITVDGRTGRIIGER